MDTVSTARWQPSTRIEKLHQAHSNATPSVGAERALHYTEFSKNLALPDESASVLNAQSLAYHLEHRSIHIHDGELIVGSHTEHRVGAICHVEKAGAAILFDEPEFETRDVNPLAVDPSVKEELLGDVVSYWLGRSLPLLALLKEDHSENTGEPLGEEHYWINEIAGIAHFLPDYGQLITLGTSGVRAKVEKRLLEADLPKDGRDYLNASLIALEAVERFSDRYRDEASRIGRHDIVDILDRVPRNPARTVREALQLIWFFQTIIQIESVDQGISFGRMDQYLYPIYHGQKERGEIDDDEVRDLIAAFCIKLSEVIPLFPTRATEFFGGLPSGQALTVGGVDAAGDDATNALTYLFLDVMEGFRVRQPNWHARISSVSDPAFVERAVSVIAGGGGSPALYNDDVIMEAMVTRGVAEEKVWDYATVGCVEPALQCESFTSSDAAIFNLAIAIEWLFGDHAQLVRGDVCERPWLAEIRSIEELLGEIETQTSERLSRMKTSLDAIEAANAEHFPTPFSSLTIGGCIENATDSTRGGAWYNASGIQAVGVADLANSLAVIQRLVFEQELYTLEEIANACAIDFEGCDLILARALKTSAFGDDEPLDDNLANRV
ncbi:MAG: hypothetical protein DRJ50_04350, partial [Actinobacteria bacterium]